MRHVRPFLLATLLAVAPVSAVFAQGAPSTKAQPTASPTTKATSAPASTAAPASTSTASAHEISTEVDAAMNEKAQALFKEGNAHFRDARYPQALSAYKAAFGLDLKSQRIVRNLGLTELELKQYRDAAEHLTIALRLSAPDDPKRAKIQSEIAEARAKVATLQMTLNVDGVELVQMDNGRSYTTPLVDPIFVDPGKVGFRIRREGYESQEKVFELKAGEETTADIKLERPAGYPGTITTASPTGSTTAAAPRSKVPAFVIGGVGIAALAAGGALVGIAVGKGGEIRDTAPKDNQGNPTCGKTARAGEDAACAGLRDQAGSASAMGNAGIGLLVGGGVLVAAAAVYLLIPSKGPADSKSSKVVPVVGREGGGLVWSGSF